jgi:hypothetical protein
VTEPLPNEESLAPPPAGSGWGRKVARTYLAVAALAALLMVRELLAGASGFGTMAISILTAPWSVLLASVAGLLAPSLAPAVMRGAGLALIVLATLLNARILYGMAARAERDARAAKASRSSGGTTHE